jgi:hypothetical protein
VRSGSAKQFDGFLKETPPFGGRCCGISSAQRAPPWSGSGEGARAPWEQDWMPTEDRYILEHRPQDHAHIVVNGARS